MHGQNRVEIEFKKLVPHQTTSEIPNSIIDGLHSLLALYFYEPSIPEATEGGAPWRWDGEK